MIYFKENSYMQPVAEYRVKKALYKRWRSFQIPSKKCDLAFLSIRMFILIKQSKSQNPIAASLSIDIVSPDHCKKSPGCPISEAKVRIIFKNATDCIIFFKK